MPAALASHVTEEGAAIQDGNVNTEILFASVLSGDWETAIPPPILLSLSVILKDITKRYSKQCHQGTPRLDIGKTKSKSVKFTSSDFVLRGDGDAGVFAKAQCLTSQAQTLYNVNVALKLSREVLGAWCECKAGKSKCDSLTVTYTFITNFTF